LGHTSYRAVEKARPFRDFLDAMDELTAGEDEARRMVHRRLAEPTGVPKRNVLVLHGGAPVLATTLRLRQHFWEPATTTCAPYLRLPHREGHLEAALAASGHDIRISEYFGDPQDFRHQDVILREVFTMPLQEGDFRSYWSYKTRRDVAKTTNKTADLTVALDDPDALDWLVSRWADNWADSPSDETGVAHDLRAVWPELLARGLLRTVTLLADGRLVAGKAMGVCGETLLSLVTARDKSWPRGSLGTRVLVAAMEAARAAGFQRLELGGYHEYKHRFAPPGGFHPRIRITPSTAGRIEARALRLRYLGRRALLKVSTIRGRAASRAGAPPP
jgi:hypothetical protein